MHQSFTLRQFKPSDLDHIIYINQTCLPENYSRFFFSGLYEEFPETFIVAEEYGKVIGYIMCRIESGMPSFRAFRIPKRGHIISIAVLPEYRNQGVGGALIQKALEAMALYRARECYLEVRVSNHPAVNLYKKLGFKNIKAMRGYYADGEDAYIMSKELGIKA